MQKLTAQPQNTEDKRGLNSDREQPDVGEIGKLVPTTTCPKKLMFPLCFTALTNGNLGSVER